MSGFNRGEAIDIIAIRLLILPTICLTIVQCDVVCGIASCLAVAGGPSFEVVFKESTQQQMNVSRVQLEPMKTANDARVPSLLFSLCHLSVMILLLVVVIFQSPRKAVERRSS